MRRGNLLRSLRIALLAYVLAMVALGAWLAKTRSTDWNDTLYMAIYPVNGDDSERSAHYIARLDERTFDPIEAFLAGEAMRYGVTLETPLEIELGQRVVDRPPPPPENRQVLAVMWWSLKLRWYASKVEHAQDLPAPDVRMFVVYHDPDTRPRLAHSLGLEKGLVGVVNAFARADLAARNNVVIAHEFLHTLGATDKYDAATNFPAFPGGYADPERQPLHPQSRAEIMGGRIPLSDSRAEMPSKLEQTVVGAVTAAEIRWPAPLR